MAAGRDTSPAFGNLTGSDQVLVAAQAGVRIAVVGAAISTGSAANVVTFNSKGSGAGTAISAGFAGPINGGFVLPPGDGYWFVTNLGEALTVTVSTGTSGVQVVWKAAY